MRATKLMRSALQKSISCLAPGFLEADFEIPSHSRHVGSTGGEWNSNRIAERLAIHGLCVGFLALTMVQVSCDDIKPSFIQEGQ